tara:strand:+ start:704 stop:2467 length:1764 start_codon:yes stop_codon:yes gene_type:complete
MTEYSTETDLPFVQEVSTLEQCADCGCSHEEGEMEATNTDGEYVCNDCGDGYCHCDCCGDQLSTDNARYSELNSEYYCEDCYYDVITHCYSCDCEESVDDIRYSERDGEYYCYSCYEDRDEYPDWQVLSNNFIKTNTDFVNPDVDRYARDSFDLIKSKRYVGIEIETNYSEEAFNSDIREYLHRRICDSRELLEEGSTGNDQNRSRQDVVYDGSVTDSEHKYGNEIVMSPRRGDLIVEDVENITSGLKRIGAYPSVRCGLHLHIDARDYDWIHFTVLTLMTKLIEPHVYTWVPPSRLTGNWSRKVSQRVKDFKHIEDREQFIDFYYDNGGFSSEKYNDKRYHGLNLHSHFQANQGIEIRYHGGTLNTEKIKHWTIFWTNVVDVCYEIGQKIKEGHRDRLSFYESFGDNDIFKSLAPIKNDKIIKLVRRYNRNHMSDGAFTDIEEYKKDSEMLRRYLKLPKRKTPYLVEPMLNYIKHRDERAFMSIESIFDTFRIPEETRDFFESRTNSIRRRNEEHIVNCFYDKSAVVEFDSVTQKFHYVENMPSQFPLLDDERLSEYNPRFDGVSYLQDLFTLSNRVTQGEYSRFI